MRLAALLVLVVIAPASALGSPDAKGFKLGTNLFTVQNKDGTSGPSTSTNGTPGLTFGVSVTWRYAAAFAVQPELLFSQKNLYTESCPGGTCTNVSDIELFYLELPLLLRLDLLPGERGKFHLDAGPEFVIVLGGGATDPMTGAYQAFDQGVRDGDDLPPVNLGVVVGAGLEFGAGPGRITIDFRYKRWFIPVLPGDNDGDIKSDHQLVALIGYAFP